MNEYHPHLYVNYITSYEKTVTYHLVMYIVPYNPTYKETLSRTRTQNTAKCPSLLLFTYVLYQHSQSFVTTFIKTSHGFFTISNIMKNWQPDSAVTTIGWGNCAQPAEVNIFPRR